MKFSPTNPMDKGRAYEFLDQLMKGKKTIEIKAISPRRSLSQNAYLHLLLQAYGAHFGYTLEEAKAIYKQLNSNVYFYEKNDWILPRSSADLNTTEMTHTIDRFRQHSAEEGYPLPSAEDKQWLAELDHVIESSKHYL